MGHAWIFGSLDRGVYVLKYSTLKFTGWITGLNEATNTYIFVIFLINKIIGIFGAVYCDRCVFGSGYSPKRTYHLFIEYRPFLLLRFFVLMACYRTN